MDVDVERLEVGELGKIASSALEVTLVHPQPRHRRERIRRHGAQVVTLCPCPVRIGLVGQEVAHIEAHRAAEALERDVGRSVARGCQPRQRLALELVGIDRTREVESR